MCQKHTWNMAWITSFIFLNLLSCFKSCHKTTIFGKETLRNVLDDMQSKCKRDHIMHIALKVMKFLCHKNWSNLLSPYHTQWHLWISHGQVLRLPHRTDAKIVKICNLWKFWLVIQQINHTHRTQSTFLQAKMSRGCRFLLFWHHSYEVTLMSDFSWTSPYNLRSNRPTGL